MAGKIVLKLSSTKMTSAASFATFVPLLPMDADVSHFEGGGIVN